MVIDIGGGTTEIAVIALSGIVCNTSIRVAGDELDDAILQYIKKTYNLLVGEQTAESIKIQIGSAFPLESETDFEVRGIDLVTGIPKTIKVGSAEIREALKEPVSMIVEALRVALEKTPPELAADIVDKGIVMTGGSSMLKGLDELLREETNLPIQVSDNPLECVVLGTGKVLDELHIYEQVLIKTSKGLGDSNITVK
jgi:rod shape-determining protein MreB